MPGLNLGTQDTSGMPAFYINGNGGFNFGYALGVNACNCPLKETENQFDWITNWTKQHGNHTIKWGAEIPRDQQQRIPSDEHRSGEICFTDSVTGNATVDALANGNATTGAGLASFLLGQPSSFGRYFTGIGLYPGLRETRIFLYGQDTWRVTRKLSSGLRGALGELPAPGRRQTRRRGQLRSAHRRCPRRRSRAQFPRLNVKPYNLGFAPRLGIAYQLQPTPCSAPATAGVSPRPDTARSLGRGLNTILPFSMGRRFPKRIPTPRISIC